MAALKGRLTLPNTPTTSVAADAADAAGASGGQLQAVCEVQDADVVLEAGQHDGSRTSLQLMQRATSLPAVPPDSQMPSDVAGEYCMRLVGYK